MPGAGSRISPPICSADTPDLLRACQARTKRGACAPFFFVYIHNEFKGAHDGAVAKRPFHELLSLPLSKSLWGYAVRSTITARGQTVIPAAIRRRFHLGPADRLEWIVDDDGIRVVPVRENPVDAFRGRGKGGATRRLLKERKKDRVRE
jgi:AbrB family looped-hinge helix DNA binding protein